MAEALIDKNAGLFTVNETGIPLGQVSNTLQLLLIEECTIPFITRYRKEYTGGLDEEQIRKIQSSYEGYLERERRRAFIIETITKMEMMTADLEKKIKNAETLNQLEDLYAPYKSKKKTRGQLAIEAGLLPLAELILAGANTLEELEKDKNKYINSEKKYNDWQGVLEGAGHILVEKFAHDSDVKEILRNDYWKDAQLKSSMKKDAEKIKDYLKYKDYFEFASPVSALKDPRASHRFLAVRRGMAQKILKVEIDHPEEVTIGLLKKKYFAQNTKTIDFLEKCAKRAHTGSIHPSLDLEIKSELKKISDESAIDIFKVNLKNLLLQPYLGAKSVIGIDPGVRTGCKIAVVDSTGKFLMDTVVYPFEPQNDVKGAKEILSRLIDHFKVEYLAVGNGTFGRETLAFCEDHLEALKKSTCKATLVNESGASIYSTSAIAKKEFPDKDATVRGAISIARRFQDPLAELVKIDAKSIGVGQYQHDVNQAKLKKGLDGVIESCVNYVGVDLNTASAPLLSYISGIGPTLAEKVVKKREDLGGIKNRHDLLKISRFSEKIFEQSAGFLRIYDGENPLDGTFIHPEKYSALEDWAREQNLGLKEMIEDKETIQKLENDQALKDKLGHFTHGDIVKSLKSKRQDPRTEFKSTDFRKDIRTIADLKKDQWYPGIVTNIAAFGAFVDIGIKENGLIHVSQMADRFVENALELLKVGEEVKVRVIDIDSERKRVALSLKKGEAGEEALPRQHHDQKRAYKGKGKQKNTEPANLKNNAFAALKGLKL